MASKPCKYFKFYNLNIYIFIYNLLDFLFIDIYIYIYKKFKNKFIMMRKC